MIGDLLNAAALIVVLGLVWWLLKMIPLPAPAHRILDVVFIIIVVLVIIGSLGLINVGVPRIISI